MSKLLELEPEPLKELLLATAEGRINPRYFTENRLHPAVELRNLFETASLDASSRLKASAVAALAEWRPRPYGLHNLRFLCQAAAMLRARSAAPQLERIVNRLLGTAAPSNTLEAETVGEAVATLAGFAPGQDVTKILERLYFSPQLRPLLAGVLLQGLCRCSPERFDVFLRRYLEITAASDVMHFEHPVFLRLFVESVTPVEIKNRWQDLDDATRGFLIEKFSLLRSADLYYSLDQEGPAIFQTSGDHSIRFTLLSRSIDQRFEDARRSYSRQLESASLAHLMSQFGSS